MDRHSTVNRPAQRLAVLAEVVRSVASYDGGEVDPGAVLADVMAALGAKEEDVGGDVHMAIFTLCDAPLMTTNTPSVIREGTKVSASKRLADWINDRHGEVA